MPVGRRRRRQRAARRAPGKFPLRGPDIDGGGPDRRGATADPRHDHALVLDQIITIIINIHRRRRRHHPGAAEISAAAAATGISGAPLGSPGGQVEVGGEGRRAAGRVPPVGAQRDGFFLFEEI